MKPTTHEAHRVLLEYARLRTNLIDRRGAVDDADCPVLSEAIQADLIEGGRRNGEALDAWLRQR
jgi:hypothetical protein